MARVVLRADTAGFHRDMRRAEGDFTRTTGQMSRGAIAGSGAFQALGRSVAFASTAFIGGAGLTYVMKSSIGAASDLNEEINKSTVIFGDSAKGVLAWSKSSATAFGLARQEALGAAGAFGNMFSTSGVAADKSAQMSEAMVKLAADMASFNNEDPTEMLDRLRSGLAGEAEPLRRFGVLLSENAVRQEAVRMGLAKNSKHLTEQEKVLARYSLIMRQTSAQQGDFARTSGGLANQQRILRAQIVDLEAVLGKALLPTVLNVTKQMTNWLSKAENQKRVTDDVNKTVAAFDDLAGAIIGTAHAMDWLHNTVGRGKSGIDLFKGFTSFLGSGRVRPEALEGPSGGIPGQLGRFLPDKPKPIFGKPSNADTTAADAALRAGTGGGGQLGGFGTGIPWLDNLLAQAEQTSGRADDRQVVTRIVAVLRSRLARTRNLGARTELMRAINRYLQQLASLDEQDAQAIRDAATKRRDAAAKRRAASLEIPERLQTLLAAAGLTERLSDDRNILARVRAFVLAQLRRRRLTLAERRRLYEQLAQVEDEIASVDEQNAQRREDRRQAAEEKRQRARDREELVVQRMEARARLTPGKLDDERALDAEQKLVNRRLAALKKRKQLSNDELREQTALYNELADIRQRREGLREKNEPGRERQAFVGELSGILGQFASNVQPAGGRTVIVNQHNYREKSSFAALREARLAAQHVF